MIISEHITTMRNGKKLKAALDVYPDNIRYLVFSDPEKVSSVSENTGKWILAGISEDKATTLCGLAVLFGAAEQAKHTAKTAREICCFYIDGSIVQQHRRILGFLMKEKAIPKKKDGTYCNIAFKFDRQTHAGEYGKDFTPKIHLSDFVDLATGEWIYSESKSEVLHNEQTAAAAAEPPLPVQENH